MESVETYKSALELAYDYVEWPYKAYGFPPAGSIIKAGPYRSCKIDAPYLMSRDVLDLEKIQRHLDYPIVLYFGQDDFSRNSDNSFVIASYNPNPQVG